MNRDTDILARTIYGEARGESISGQEAIASVILNRVAFAKRRGRYWWGNTIARRLPCAVAVFLLERKRSQPEDYRTGR